MAVRQRVVFLALFVLAPCVAVSAQVASPSQMQVVMLGTGTPVPDPERSGPALAVVVNGTAYLVDAGPGVVRRAQAAAEKDHITALQPARLHVLFLTHLHSDHTAGLPDLMLTPSVVGRPDGMEIYGPTGTVAMVQHLREAYAKDIAVRTNSEANGEHEPAARYNFQAHDIKPGVVYQDANVKVTALLVRHGNWDEALGYAFESGGHRIVISGDTRPAESLVKACDGCDILVHEVYSSSGFLALPKDSRAYYRAFHTSTEELAKIATDARPKELVLTHVLLMPDEDSITDEIYNSGYKGTVVVAQDLDVFPEEK